LRRGRELIARSTLSASELDLRQAKAQTAAAQVQEAEAAVHRTELDLEDTLLRSPTPGIVLKKLKEAGEIAVPGGFAGSGDLVRIANLDDLRAEVDVNESDLSRVRLGQRAEVTPDAIADARFAAVVVKLDPQVDRQKGTLKVQVRLTERDRRLLPDMSARVSFLGDPPADGSVAKAVLAPSASVRRGTDGRAYVWIARSGVASRVFVESAGLLGDQVRITKGLEGDEEVVVGDEPTREGQRIRAASPGPS
jgi:RND family efflux transporter MFP subunit